MDVEQETASETEPKLDLDFGSEPSPGPGRIPALSPEADHSGLLETFLETYGGDESDTEDEEVAKLFRYVPK